ncbi:hypothetical protein GCM10018793_07050 [Streptomyces sulfonofaciens]|uniref:Uncharacterized protein n=1 Tax=Streptomyces sulfonofaciens TaxID=68272 RepID=A0A919FU70_9ACTN|nr:hypothetical protein GCM10018793_07050 [Streptomyces sulfonofaciens]
MESAGSGRFGPEPQSAYDEWPAFRVRAPEAVAQAREFDPAALGAPVPRPSQGFAIGADYAETPQPRADHTVCPPGAPGAFPGNAS